MENKGVGLSALRRVGKMMIVYYALVRIRRTRRQGHPIDGHRTMSLTILACRILRGAVVLYLVPFYWRSIPSNITDFKVSVILHTYSVLLAKKYVSIYKSVHMFCVHFSVNIYSIVTVHPNFFQTLQMSRSDTYVHI